MNKKNRIYILLSIFLCLIVALIFYNNKEIYKISPRINKVKESKIKDSKFKTIGWLRVQGTNIDYPIIFTEDPKEQFPITLESYVWSENTDDKFHSNIQIVGHNIFNLSSKPKKHSKKFKRFEELMAFEYYDFAKENQYIQLTIDNHEYLYKIFSVSFIGVSTGTFLPKMDDIENTNFNRFKEIIDNNNLYKYDVDYNKKDKFISLSTCTRSFINDFETTYYVHGRLLREGEKATRYKVKKSEKYKEIEKLWEDDEDEKDPL